MNLWWKKTAVTDVVNPKKMGCYFLLFMSELSHAGGLFFFFFLALCFVLGFFKYRVVSWKVLDLPLIYILLLIVYSRKAAHNWKDAMFSYLELFCSLRTFHYISTECCNSPYRPKQAKPGNVCNDQKCFNFLFVLSSLCTTGSSHSCVVTMCNLTTFSV